MNSTNFSKQLTLNTPLHVFGSLRDIVRKIHSSLGGMFPYLSERDFLNADYFISRGIMEIYVNNGENYVVLTLSFRRGNYRLLHSVVNSSKTAKHQINQFQNVNKDLTNTSFISVPVKLDKLIANVIKGGSPVTSIAFSVKEQIFNLLTPYDGELLHNGRLDKNYVKRKVDMNVSKLPKYRLGYLQSVSGLFYKLLRDQVSGISRLEFVNAYYEIEPGAISIELSQGRVLKLAVGGLGARIMETNIFGLEGKEVRLPASSTTERINELLQKAVDGIVKASNDRVLTFTYSIPYGYLQVRTYRGKIYTLKSEVNK
jgi:hypothetical protein